MVASLDKRFKFTKETVAKLPLPATGAAVYYDKEVPKLGIRVQPSGTKSYFLLKQVGGRPQKATLGRADEMSIEDARSSAQKKLVELTKWKDEGCVGVSPLLKPEEGYCFAEAFESYIKYLYAPREQRPIKDPEAAEARARALYDRHLARPLKALPLEQVTGERLERLHRSIGEDERLRGKRRVGGHIAANRALELVKAVFRYALRKQLVRADPTVSVEGYRETKRKRFLQPDELVRLRKALDNEPNQDLKEFVELLLLTGVRKSSLYAARFDELSEVLKVWNIPVTKNGEPLTVQLTPNALSIFKARRKRLGNGDAWVFPSATAESGHLVDFKNQWKRLRKAANVPDVTFHDLRRTNASFQVIAGASLPIVGASLGHKSAESTEVYARLHGDAVRRSLIAGEAMQAEMMFAAKKQMKAAARKRPRLLPAPAQENA